MKLSQATPELPVADLDKALQHYCNAFDFSIAWVHESGEIGAVSHGECGLFLRRTPNPVTPVRIWIFVDDVDAAFANFAELGADVIEPPETKPWNIRQCTLQDVDGNKIVLHHDV